MRRLRRLLGPRLPIADMLLLCERCGRDTVLPIRWTEVEDLRWRVRLVCSVCGHERATTVSRPLARALSERLTARAGQMERWIDAFTAALDEDHISARDF